MGDFELKLYVFIMWMWYVLSDYGTRYCLLFFLNWLILYLVWILTISIDTFSHSYRSLYQTREVDYRPNALSTFAYRLSYLKPYRLARWDTDWIRFCAFTLVCKRHPRARCGHAYLHAHRYGVPGTSLCSQTVYKWYGTSQNLGPPGGSPRQLHRRYYSLWVYRALKVSD